MFRTVYHRISGGRWLWGIIGYIEDRPKPVRTDTKLSISEQDFEDLIEEIFKGEYDD